MTTRRIPFPGILTEQEKANLRIFEESRFYNLRYFEFDTSLFGRSKTLMTLPQDAMAIAPIFLKVLQGFDASDLRLNLGSPQDGASMASIPVGPVGTFTSFTPRGTTPTTIFAVPLKSPTTITAVLINDGSSIPTRGKGWCIFPWLLMTRVKGYSDATN